MPAAFGHMLRALFASAAASLLAPAEVAFAVRFLCSPLARGINGQALPLDGGQVMK